MFGASGLENDLNCKGEHGREAVAMYPDPDGPRNYGVLLKRPVGSD